MSARNNTFWAWKKTHCYKWVSFLLTHEEYVAIKGHSWDTLILSLSGVSVNRLTWSCLVLLPGDGLHKGAAVLYPGCVYFRTHSANEDIFSSCFHFLFWELHIIIKLAVEPLSTYAQSWWRFTAAHSGRHLFCGVWVASFLCASVSMVCTSDFSKSLLRIW